MLKVYNVNYHINGMAQCAIFLDKDDCDKFMLETKDAKLTVVDTKDIIYRYNICHYDGYVQFLGKSINLGTLSYKTGQYETNCFTIPEYEEEAKKLYDEMVRKRVQESKDFYNSHIWL